MSDRRTNIRVGLLVVGLGLFGLGYLVPVHVGGLASSPALLPVLGFSALVLLGAALCAAALKESEDELPGEADGEETEPVSLPPIIGVLALYAALLGQLGFLLASAIGLSLLLLIYRIRRPMPLLLVTAGTIAVIHVGIERLLGTPLPAGQVLKALPF